MNNLIVFDLDGTLLYTLEDICTALNVALKKANLREITLEEAKNLVGDGVIVLIKRLMTLVGATSGFEELLADYQAYYSCHNLVHTRPYKNVVEVLKELKNEGYLLAVLSNKPDADTKEIIKHFFPDTFIEVIGKGKFKLKPDPESLNYLKDKYQAKTIMVGDSINDLLVAKNANCVGIYASYGYQVIEDAKYQIKDFKDLIDLIKTLN